MCALLAWQAFTAWAAGAGDASDLTPMGAERAGNEAGTIPPWTGGLTEPPPGFDSRRHAIDPFPGDKPLFVIDAGNLDAHRDRLSPGQQALIERYPDSWRIPVYRSRRTAAFPPAVYEAIARNAETAQLITEGQGGVSGSSIASPFPRPRSGVEVVWNHSLRWRAVRILRTEGTAAVTRAGRFTLTVALQDLVFPYALPPESIFYARHPNVLLALKTKTVEPTFLTGDGILVHETINQTDDPRKTWRYVKSARRVIRSPNFGYQLPAPNTDGLRTVDDFGLYNGPPHRFEWRLVGKRELYVPYNAYRLNSDALKPAEIVRRGHINPEHARYELHRVWEVEGTLKADARHIYGKRVFYVDEDSWQIAVADTYDLEGQLWRVNEAHAINYYQVPVLWTTLEVFHDLQQERVLVNGLDNTHPPYRFREDGDPREFSPNALIYYLR